MTLPLPELGMVIHHRYLSQREDVAGAEERRKDRPCAIVAAITRTHDETRLVGLPITHSPPSEITRAIEIPVRVKKSLGFDPEHSWIVVTEGNDFIWPGPALRPHIQGDLTTITYGFLPPLLLEAVRRRFLEIYKSGEARTVKRTE